MEAKGYEDGKGNSNILGIYAESNCLPKGSSSSSISSGSSSGSSSVFDEKDDYMDSILKSAIPDYELQRPVSLPELPEGTPYSPPESIRGSHMQFSLSNMPGRPAGYDPNRIPPNVFASKPSTPTEWSVASNESLFSIHVGNGSFSRDHMYLMIKSGELPMIDESFTVPAAALPVVTEAVETDRKPMIDEPMVVPPSPAIVSEAANIDRRRENMARDDSLAPEVFAQTTNVVVGETAKDHAEQYGKGKMPPTEDHGQASSRISCHSDESLISTSSFVFPVLAEQNGNGASAKEVHLEEEKRPEKQSPPQPQPQPQRQPVAEQPSYQKQPEPQPPAEIPKGGWCCWFSCFSCCRFC